MCSVSGAVQTVLLFKQNGLFLCQLFDPDVDEPLQSPRGKVSQGRIVSELLGTLSGIGGR